MEQLKAGPIQCFGVESGALPEDAVVVGAMVDDRLTVRLVLASDSVDEGAEGVPIPDLPPPAVRRHWGTVQAPPP